jgi:hypothetical protein
MINEQERELIQSVDRDLQNGLTIEKAAALRNLKMSTLYHKIRRAGYRLEKFGRLVPIGATPLESSREDAA